MYKHFIVLCTVSCIAICFTIGWAQHRESDPDFQAFLEQITNDIFMPINIRGVSMNNLQRAMIFGYALKRQSGYLGESEADKTRLNRLKENVKGFLSEISPDTDLWSVTDEAFRGRHDNEVLRLCGGQFKWPPIFTSIGKEAFDKGVVVAGEDQEVKPPRLLKKVDPIYPELLRKARIQGVVALRVWVNEEGNVEKTEIIKSDYFMLNNPAIEAVKQWKYEVLYIKGKPTPVVFDVFVTFKLK